MAENKNTAELAVAHLLLMISFDLSLAQSQTCF